MLTETMREWYEKTSNSVHGVQYGYKITNGIRTNELCVVFSVLNKKPLAELTQEEILPTSLVVDNETIKTDVVQRARASLRTENSSIIQSHTSVDDYGRCSQGENLLVQDPLVTPHRAMVRPLRGGISIGHLENEPSNPPITSGGTLGGIFRDKVDGSVVGLTCAHIVCQELMNVQWSDSYSSSYWSEWDIQSKRIVQPGTIDGGNINNSIGHIKRYYPIAEDSVAGSAYNYIDAAVIGIDNVPSPYAPLCDNYSGTQLGPDQLVHYPVATGEEIENVFDIVNTNGTPRYPLVKSGRTTGYVNAVVGGNCGVPNYGNVPIKLLSRPMGNMFTLNWNDWYHWVFRNILEFAFDAAAYRTHPTLHDPFSLHYLPNVCMPGDSGSLLLADFDGVLKIVGLIFAGSTTDVDPDGVPYPDMGLAPEYFAGTRMEFPNNIGYACRIDTVMEQLQLEPIGSNEIKVNPSTNWLFREVPRRVLSNRTSPRIGIPVNGGSDPRTFWECGQRGENTVYVTYSQNLSPPQNLSIVAIGNGQVTLKWDFPASNGGSDIIAYLVEYSTSGGASWQQFNYGSSCTETDCRITVTGLLNGTRYVFRVRAQNAIVVSQPSNVSASATPATVPGKPTSVVAVKGNASLAVTWVAPARNGGSLITEYIVKYSSNNGVAGSWERFGVDPLVKITATSCTVTGLTNGTSYIIKVIAKNAVGVGVASINSASATPAMPATAPGSPTGVVAVRGNASLSVTWVAPANNGGSVITDYPLDYSSKGGVPGSWTRFDRSASSQTSSVVTGLTNGTAYVIRVSAGNAVGYSAASDYSVSVTPATVPGSPTSVVAVSRNASLAVTWLAPTSTGGSAITDYLVKYSSNGGSTWTNFVHPVSIVPSLTVTGLANGTAYVIKVIAKNAVGISLPSANSAPAKPAATVPGSPTSVMATSGNTSLGVTWVSPASNGGSPITDYLVKYSSNSGATWKNFIHPPLTASPLTVTGLTNGTPYVIKVIARNAIGISLPSVNSAPAIPNAP